MIGTKVGREELRPFGLSLQNTFVLPTTEKALAWGVLRSQDLGWFQDFQRCVFINHQMAITFKVERERRSYEFCGVC